MIDTRRLSYAGASSDPLAALVFTPFPEPADTVIVNGRIVVESDGHSPFACRAEACDQVRSMKSGDDDNDFFPRRVEFGSGPTVVHLSSHNGPVSVKNSD